MIRIGITSCALASGSDRQVINGRALYYIDQGLAHYVMQRQAAVSVILPIQSHELQYEDMIEQWDAVIFHGGADIDPSQYSEKSLKPEWQGDVDRDQFEVELLQACLKSNIPVLGICRGMQLINIALGGSLYQDVQLAHDKALQHRNAEIYEKNYHQVLLNKNGILNRLYNNTDSVWVNSVHHQCVKDLGEGLCVEATSPQDDIIEAIFLQQKDVLDPFCLGVQWHPEYQTHEDHKLIDPFVILDFFIDAINHRLKQ